MKLQRLFLCAALAALPVVGAFAADGTEDDPFTLVPGGENAYNGTSEYTWWQYTPSEDQMVTFSNIGAYAMKDGEGNYVDAYYAISNSYSSEGQFTIFPAKAGTKYLIQFYRSKSTMEPTYTIDCSVKAQPYNLGTDAENPVVAADGASVFLGTTGRMGVYTPCYVNYTSTVDGVLDMRFNSEPQAVYLEVGGSYVSLGSTSKKMTMAVEAGKTYSFKVESYVASIITFEARIPVPGASRDDAWTAVAGANEIPAAAGTYWWKYTVPADGYLTIFSDADASMDFYSADDETAEVTLNNVAYRKQVYQGTSYVFSINKGADTLEPESFELKIGYEPYDVESTAPLIEADQTCNTPVFNGKFFYTVKTPAEGAYFLNLNVDSTNSDITVGLSQKEEQYGNVYYSSLANEYKTSLKYAVEADSEYVISVTTPVGLGSVPFKVTFTEVQPGETLTNPIAMVEGENNLNASVPVYYSFTPAKGEYVTLTIPTGITVDCYPKTDKYGTVTPTDVTAAEGFNGKKFKLSGSVDYIFEFRGETEGKSFTVALADFAAGEDWSTAIAVPADGYADLPATGGETWFKYTVNADGFVVLTTDMDYTWGSQVKAYVNIVGNSVLTMSSAYDYNTGSYSWKELKIPVLKGDVVYAQVVDIAPSADKVLIFTEVAPAPGETPATAIRVVMTDGKGSVDFPIIDYSSAPVYYVVSLEEGMFFTSSAKGAECILYNNKDCSSASQVATASSWSSYTNEEGKSVYGFNKVAITTAGDYYIKVTQVGGFYDTDPIPVQFINRAALPGEAASNPLAVEMTGDPIEWTITKLAYGDVRWYSFELQTGDLFITTEDFAEDAENTPLRAAGTGTGFQIYGSLYAADNLDTPIASVQQSANYKYIELSATIAEPGTYLFKLTQMYNSEGVAKISGSAAVPEESSVAEVAAGNFAVFSANNGLTIVAADAEVSVYDLNGRKVAALNVNGVANVALQNGIYVVTNGQTTVKALVK